MLHDAPGQLDRVPDMPETGNGTRILAGPVHDGCVELSQPISRESRSAARIEQRIIFEHSDSERNGIETCSAALEHGAARLDDLRKARSIPG
jgi:hypothetical protein